MTNASDDFFGGGEGLNYPLGSEAQWLGKVRGGRIITEPKQIPQTNINTKETLYWDKDRTRPMMQLVFTVVCDGSGKARENGWNTDERVDAQDNGHRQMYIKGKDLTEAVGAQLKKHGVPGLRIGDEIYNVWTGHRPGKTPGTNARTWASLLFPGAGPAQGEFFGNQQQPNQTAAPSGFGAPQHQQPPAAANPYGYGHNPAGSPGQQAYASAEFNAGPPPQFQSPSGPAGPAPHPSQFQQNPAGSGQFRPDDNGWVQGDAQHAVSGQQPSGFGQPVPPVDNPWGRTEAQQSPGNMWG